MNKLNQETIKSSIFDISQYETVFSSNQIKLVDIEVIDKLCDHITQQSGFAALHGLSKVLARHGLSIDDAKEMELGRLFYEDIFRAIMQKIDLTHYDPVGMNYSHIAKMDVDGYNKNKSFSPNSDHTEAREFVTTKCIHFDAATTFVANIYGPSKNIKGGLPIICDTKQFCIDRGIDPKVLIENIPNNYNVAVKERFYDELMNDYSFALPLDQENDPFMIVLYNEVIGGVAHAATTPQKKDNTQEAVRPLRHIEHQVQNMEDLKKWYDFYGVKLEKASNDNTQEVNLTLDYHKKNDKGYQNIFPYQNEVSEPII
ncbi:hypothetical protein [Cysteiniphilum litorale]|uniref:hypothetical protein n=1 Tax=Cysteiniphilum litorale TaxID=2056700 RepID=UPI003F8812BD